MFPICGVRFLEDVERIRQYGFACLWCNVTMSLVSVYFAGVTIKTLEFRRASERNVGDVPSVRELRFLVDVERR